AALERLGELSADNLLRAIEASKDRPLSKLLVGLGIRHLGPAGARALARAMGSLDALTGAGTEALAVVEGIGPVIADSVAEFLASPSNQAVIDKLRAAGVALEERGADVAAGDGAVADAAGLPQTLTGKPVVVTGTLEGFTREGAEEAILARGGTSPGSVSKRTWAVVVGTEPGASKLRKAEELGIPVVDGSLFTVLLESGELPGG
ncbi:MAG TPA: helix-hairpin-helix domain-containing protein, partial [Acidimicrobiales bacterium]|nr:helix-hairpin-helix domain-containing protein [Acidimicrobiales bacterium]